IKYARQTGRKENIVILLPDSAQKYLSKIFNDDWMRENVFLGEDEGLGTVQDLLRERAGGVITAHPSDRVRDVIARLKEHGISNLPVEESGKLLGIISEVDLLRTLLEGENKLDSAVGPLVSGDLPRVFR